MKHFLSHLIGFSILINSLSAEIVQTTNIEDIRTEITKNTLVLFNVAEVLMDTETSVGSQQWRQLLRSAVNSETHDHLTLYAFKKVPHKTPEPITAELIQDLQSQGIVALGLTSRGRSEWYSSYIPDIDLITEKRLSKIGIDFSKTQLPDELTYLPDLFVDYYHEGIIYAGNCRDKEELLLEILSNTSYKPEKIILIDDKIESLIAVEQVLETLEIPFIGYHYSRTALNHANFNPLIAIFQANWLFKFGEVISDEAAADVLDWNKLYF